MKQLLKTILYSMFFFAACKNKINTYQNKYGINPSSLAGIDTANYTKIQWEDTLKNFGIIKEGDSVLIKFKFKNTGETVLYILEVLPACGCTVADYPRNAIMPGEGGDIIATFNTIGQTGNVTKNIMVKTNTSNKILQKLEFTGEVIKNKPE